MALFGVRSYKASNVKLYINRKEVTWLAEDQFIDVNRPNDRIDTATDLTQGGMYLYRNVNPGSVTVRLLSTSPWVAVLSNLCLNAEPVQMFLKDANSNEGSKSYICEKAVVAKQNNITYGAEVMAVEFVIKCIELTELTDTMITIDTVNSALINAKYAVGSAITGSFLGGII